MIARAACTRESHATAPRSALTWCGVQTFDEEGMVQTLLNCPCGSTLARTFPESSEARRRREVERLRMVRR